MITDGNYTYYHGEHLVKYVIVESLCCRSETIIAYQLYFNNNNNPLCVYLAQKIKTDLEMPFLK